MKANFQSKRIVFLGCGAVGKATLSVLLSFVQVLPVNVTIVDLLNYRSHPDVQWWLERGATYDQRDIRVHFKEILHRLMPYDIVIDLTNRTDSFTLIRFCKKHNLHYINTSMEDEETLNSQRLKYDTFAMSYTHIHAETLKLNTAFPDTDATCVLEIGMNPGIVSLMAKRALRELGSLSKTANPNFAALAKSLNVQVIHISETDSSEFTGSRKPSADVFCNTWCCDGLNDEYAHDAEMSFGTHERSTPTARSMWMDDVVIDALKPAFQCYTESYVPGETFVGCIIPHGEGISLGQYLKTRDYHPTVHYVYKWSPLTQRSLLKTPVQKIGDTFAPNCHVVANYYDDFFGVDKVGVLLLRPNQPAFWCGSILDNSSVGLHSGTLQQVTSGIMAALLHIAAHPKTGIVFPEALHDSLLDEVMPLLGKFVCEAVPYTRDTQFSLVPKSTFDAQF